MSNRNPSREIDPSQQPVHFMAQEGQFEPMPAMQIMARQEHLAWPDGGKYFFPFATAMAATMLERYLNFDVDHDLTKEGLGRLFLKALRPITESFFDAEPGVGSVARVFNNFEEAIEYFENHGGSRAEFEDAIRQLAPLSRAEVEIPIMHSEQDSAYDSVSRTAQLTIYKLASGNDESSYVSRFEMSLHINQDHAPSLSRLLCGETEMIRQFIVLGIQRIIDMRYERLSLALTQWELMRRSENNGELTPLQKRYLTQDRQTILEERDNQHTTLDELVKDEDWGVEDADELFGDAQTTGHLVREMNTSLPLRYLTGIPLEYTSLAHFANDRIPALIDFARNNELGRYFVERFQAEGLAALIDYYKMFGGLENVTILTGVFVEHETLRRALSGPLAFVTALRLFDNIVHNYRSEDVEHIQESDAFKAVAGNMDLVRGLAYAFAEVGLLNSVMFGVRQEAREDAPWIH